jgi:hypothetical protein
VYGEGQADLRTATSWMSLPPVPVRSFWVKGSDSDNSGLLQKPLSEPLFDECERGLIIFGSNLAAEIGGPILCSSGKAAVAAASVGTERRFGTDLARRFGVARQSVHT